MLRKIAIAALAIGLAGPAFAQYVMSDDMGGFYNPDGTMRAETEVTTLWGGMPAEKQATLREECKSQKGSAGISEAQQEFCNWLAKRN
jgi:hypothetical protein